MEPVSDEIRTLRRTMRDLVALSALPAVWAGYRPHQVAEGLADVLLETLRLDLVYLRLPERAEGQEIEVARTAGGPTTPDQTRDLGRALAPWLDAGGADPAPSIPNPAGSGTVRLVVIPIGYDQQVGVLVAGSQQTGFPSEEDRLLLSVGANQAAAVFQQQRAATALRESEEHHRSIIAALQEGVVVRDNDSRLIVCNASAERILGLSAQELEERRSSLDPRLRAIHEDGTPFSRETFPGAVALRTGQPSSNVVIGVYKPDGELTWIAVNSQPLFRTGGHTPYAVVDSFSDITARRRAEEELRLANARLELAVRGSKIGIWEVDTPDGDVRHVRRYYVNVWEQLGYERPDFPTDRETAMAPVHPDDRALIEEAARRYLAGETSTYEVESRSRHKDGSYRWMLIRGVAVRDALGRPIRFVGSSVDITDRRRAEEALRESEERFRGTFENAAVGIAHADFEGRWLRVNQKYCEIVGYSREELLQRTFQDITHPDDLATNLEMWAALLRGESPNFSLEKRNLRKDGSPVWVEVFTSLQRDAAGEPAYAITIVQDISERKRLEEALRASEERFRGTFENAAVGIAHADPAGRFLRVNEKFCSIVGHSREELLRRTYQDITHPDDLAASVDATAALFRGESPNFGLEKRFVRKDGSLVWAQVFVSLQRDAAGAPAYDIGIIHDITERKRLEEALRASEERYRFLIRSIPQKIFTADANGDVDYLNQQWTEFAGLSFDQLKGWGWTQIIHPEDVEENVRRSRHAIATGEPFQLEHRVRRADGVYRWHLSRAVALRDAQGRVLMWFGSNTDIDDQKQTAEAFKQAKEAAEAANRAKDEFLANVSHEIRTPMNAILGMTELALDTPLTEDQRQCLRTVKSAADNLLGIINDLLDFAKIAAGKLELVPDDFSLRAAVGDTLRALATRAHKKGLELACNVQPEVPDALVGDAARLRQVLLNLVGNAIKFTENGEVVVRVEASGDPIPEEGAAGGPAGGPALTAEVGLRFTVTDTGIGIPPDKQERIFRAFEQEDTSTTRKYGGTGLGLTIAARLVALMGGEITVDSAPGRGSTFAFTARFGLQPHPAEQTPAWPPVLLRGLRVLVVDDNPTNRHILQEWLTGWQMEPVAVGDGLAALGALWDAVSVGRPFPLVLLDARMPDTDGLALAARIRERAALSDVRIILLTSDHRPGDSARSRELRIDAHLLKPVQQDELLQTINRVMSRAQGDAAAVEEPTREPGPVPAAAPLRILLAEDDEFSAQLMDKLLGRRGHRVRPVSSGREALALAGQGAFDLMLLDVHMPELDGIAVVRGIRERERVAGGHLPVIALTARSRKEDRERCLAAGVDDFLTKPVSAADLLAAIDRLLRRDEGRGMRDEGTASSPRSPLSSLIPHPSSLPLLDPVAILRACGEDAEALRGMCRAFETYLPVRVAEMGDALRAQDALRLREAAHKLCALLFAFSKTAGDAAVDLENQAAQGRLAEAQPLVERLEAMAQELLPLVAGLSLETLRLHAEATGNRQPPVTPPGQPTENS
jgi:two-component system sensor histidine kinase/response regulator